MGAVRKKATGVGVGMPAALMLDEFGSQVWYVFGGPPYLVGSALVGKKWRDVDVRAIIDDDRYEAMRLGDPKATHQNGRWVALCLAFSALGRQMTGLPIDFQIQQQTEANRLYPSPKHRRSALGHVELRMMPTSRRRRSR